MNRHDRYFKKIVVIIAIIVAVIFINIMHDYYKQKAQKISDILQQIEAYRQAGETLKAVDLVKAQESTQFKKIWPFLEKQAPILEAPFYFAFATQFAVQKREEEMLFWLYLGRMQFNYDALRCKDTKAAIALRDSLLKRYYFPEQTATINVNILERVLNYDAVKMPQDYYPVYFCAYLEGPFRNIPQFIDKQKWPQIKSGLRQSAATLIENSQ